MARAVERDAGSTAGGLGSAAEPKRPGQTRFPAFDGFRAIAAVSVVVTHVAAVSSFNSRSWLGAFTARMDVGVAVFFLISGFLLYRPFVVARFADEPGPRTVPFLWRRFLRIFPAYWFALTLVVYVLDAVPGGNPDPIHNAKDFFLFYSLVHVYSLGHVFSPIAQAWTLSIELTFYLLLPLWALAMRKLGGHDNAARFRVEVIGLAVLAAAGTAYRFWVTFGDFGFGRTGQLLHILPAWLDLFALGMLLAVVSAWVARRGAPSPAGLDHPWAPAVCWALSALSFVAVSVWIGEPPNPVLTDFTGWQETGVHYLYGAVAFFLLLPGIFGPQDQGVIRGLLRNRVVQLVGLVSYGIYLWHEALIEQYTEWRGVEFPITSSFVQMLAATLVLTLVAATVSYVVVERPALRLKDRLSLYGRRAAARPT